MAPNPGWCIEMAEKISRLDEKCKFEDIFIASGSFFMTTSVSSGESTSAVEEIRIMDPGWCSELTEKIMRLDEKCKFEEFFIRKRESLITTSVDAESIEDIGVMDPEWCSEMIGKIMKLDEKCKFGKFFIPSEEEFLITTSARAQSMSSIPTPPQVHVDKCIISALKSFNSVKEASSSSSDQLLDVVDIRITSTLRSSQSYAPQNFWYFNPTREASNKLLDALKDEKCYIIGFHGKKGSGKTALVTAEKAEYWKIFDQVLFLNGSNSDLQGRIVSQLNLSFEENTSNLERSYKIKSILESRKKVLVIFDHVISDDDSGLTEFDPRDIGIPDPGKQCKLLWITRDKNNRIMRGCCHHWIPLHRVSDEDAWKLLQQYSGIDDDDDNLFNVAREVATRCKGLPGVIEDVVSSLGNKNTEDDRKLKEYWTESLDCLKHETASYQIFISFRGTDTRDDFTESLYDALDHAGFKVFIDKKIRSGDRVSQTLIKAIEQSRASIVVLSQNYAQSSWCLDELLKIMECGEKIKQLVYPIYFKVDPSHVRHLLGTYKEAMAKKKERFGEDKVQEWTSALHEVAGLSGNHYNGGSVKKFIQEVVEYLKGNKHRLHII